MIRVGLALSGGAARGIAHIGVLQYLEERGVKPCCIAGTSAGSIVGAFYCAGNSIDDLKKIIKKMSWKDLVKITIPRKGLIDSSRLLRVIKEQLGDTTFEELKIPLFINAVDLISGEEVVFKKGSVAEAVQASCAIPGIFTPVKLGQHLLVDGGLIDNVPVALIDKRNIDYIIAVNVGAQKPLKKEPDNIFEVLIQSFDIIRRQRDMPAYKSADKLIEPDLGDFSFWDNSKLNDLVRIGYDEAKYTLDEVNFTSKKINLFGWIKNKKVKRG
jgi:NTE family protein